MYGGAWWASLTYAGTFYSRASLGLFNPNSGLDTCFDQAIGYAGAWYAGIVYAGTPFCIELFNQEPVPQPGSNVQDLCIVVCTRRVPDAQVF